MSSHLLTISAAPAVRRVTRPLAVVAAAAIVLSLNAPAGAAQGSGGVTVNWSALEDLGTPQTLPDLLQPRRPQAVPRAGTAGSAQPDPGVAPRSRLLITPPPGTVPVVEAPPSRPRGNAKPPKKSQAKASTPASAPRPQEPAATEPAKPVESAAAPEPKLPEVNLPDAKAPEVKAAAAPEPKLPEVKLPEAKAPEVKAAAAPEPKLPEVKLPDAKAPEVKAAAAPEPKLPEVKLPAAPARPAEETVLASAPTPLPAPPPVAPPMAPPAPASTTQSPSNFTLPQGNFVPPPSGTFVFDEPRKPTPAPVKTAEQAKPAQEALARPVPRYERPDEQAKVAADKASFARPPAPQPPPPPQSSPQPGTGRVVKDGTLAFAPGDGSLPPEAESSLRAMVAALQGDPDATIRIMAYAAEEAGNPSKARRLSLTRGLAVRGWLMEQGIASPRIDVRALGTPSTGAADRVDITLTAP